MRYMCNKKRYCKKKSCSHYHKHFYRKDCDAECDEVKNAKCVILKEKRNGRSVANKIDKSKNRTPQGVFRPTDEDTRYSIVY